MSPGRRLLPSSIRFRLTAWYALLLTGVLLVLGLSVLGLTRDRLSNQVDGRLKKTAADIYNASAQPNQADVRWQEGRRSVEGIRPGLNAFASRGLSVQVLNAHGRVVERSPYAPSEPLSAWNGTEHEWSPVFSTTTVNSSQMRVVHFPFLAKEDEVTYKLGAILVGEFLDEYFGTIDALERTLLSTSVAGLALAVLGGWLLAGRALRPVSRVTATAAQIAAGDGSAASLATRLRVPDTGDEIARLSGTFNAMLDRLQASFVAQQRFVADASHELRTPLTAIRGNVEVLARQVAARSVGPDVKGDLGAALDDVKRASARMGRLLDDLLLLDRSDAPATETLNPRPVRLDEIVRNAVRGAAALVAGQRLEVVAPTPVTVSGDADRLLQLLLILVENALRHTPAGAAVSVVVEPPAGGTVRLVVRDEGEGIAPEHLPHLFDRFYRADGARGRATGGTGLGLAIARAIARAHGGEITVESSPGRGTAFTVSLPPASADAAPVTEAHA